MDMDERDSYPDLDPPSVEPQWATGMDLLESIVNTGRLIVCRPEAADYVSKLGDVAEGEGEFGDPHEVMRRLVEAEELMTEVFSILYANVVKP